MVFLVIFANRPLAKPIRKSEYKTTTYASCRADDFLLFKVSLDVIITIQKLYEFFSLKNLR